MIKTVGLLLAFILGSASVITVGATMFKQDRPVAVAQPPQDVQVGAKADRLLSAPGSVADAGSGRREVDADAVAMLSLAPLIFAQPSHLASPLVSVPDERGQVAAEKGDWRKANALASSADIESERPVRPLRPRKPRVAVARERPAADAKTCIQPTGFNGFLASLDLKPRCEIGRPSPPSPG